MRFNKSATTPLGVVRASDRSNPKSHGLDDFARDNSAQGVVRVSYQADAMTGGAGYIEGSDPALGVVRIASQPQPVVDEPVYFEDPNPVTFNSPGLFDEEYLIFRRDQGDGRGYDDGYTSIGFFAPIIGAGTDELIFNNTRLNFTDRGELAANFGIGGRRFFESINRIVGISTWFDTDKSDTGNRYDQFGIGIELLGENWDLRANIANPTAHGSNSLGTVFGLTPFFQTNQILFNDIALAEQALTSADIEFGVGVPNFPGVKVYAGPYWYDSEDREDKFGTRVRVEAYLSDAASGQIAVSNDPLFGTTLNVAVSYAIGAKWQPLRPFRKKTMRERMFEQVARINRIPSRRFVAARIESPAINPATGLAYTVTHVDNSNPNAPGDGTFENPFTTLTPAGPTGSDLIVVRRGTTSRTTLLAGGTALANNQRLLGEGVPHTFIAVNRGTFLLPGVDTAGTLPFATAANGSVVTLGNNNEVSGLNLISPLNGNAIGGAGINNFNINNINNDINLALAAPGNNSGAGAGIVLTNASGVGTIDNVRFNSTQAGSAGGIVVQNTGAAPFTLNLSNVPFSQGGLFGVQVVANNSNIAANLTNVNASSTGDGARFTASNAGSITATVSQSTFSNSTGTGLAADVAGAGSNIFLNASNVVAQGNTLDGISFVSGTGSSFQGILNNNTFNNNTRNAIRTVLTGGSTGFLTVANTTGTGSGEHGLFLSITDSTLTPSTFTTVDVSNSGQQLNAGLRDGVNIDASNSNATINLTSITGVNTLGNTTQENGLRQVIDGGSTVTTVVDSSNFSSNQISGISTQVRDAGTTSNLTVTGTTANGNVLDGFLFDIDNGNFNANVTTSSFNNSGRNAIRAIGGAVGAVTNVTFNSTTANNSAAEGAFFLINGGGAASTFNFTYLTTPPSAILNSGGANGVNAAFDGANTTGTVNFNGLTIDGGVNSLNTNGATVNVIFP
ncbi:MAG: hypothetical protein HOK71_16330 [Planctomycetaceae bacterium]|nr:hypothetical protein [Planctomycetaceae bacterium]MBT6486214.1 hypothetical protein [Planctomycetaceae bacterium]